MIGILTTILVITNGGTSHQVLSDVCNTLCTAVMGKTDMAFHVTLFSYVKIYTDNEDKQSLGDQGAHGDTKYK